MILVCSSPTNFQVISETTDFSQTSHFICQCTVVGKGHINYFSIFDFIASEQTTEDIWRLKGQNCENLCLKVPYFQAQFCLFQPFFTIFTLFSIGKYLKVQLGKDATYMARTPHQYVNIWPQWRSDPAALSPDFMVLKIWKIEGFNTKVIDVCGHSWETFVSTPRYSCIFEKKIHDHNPSQLCFQQKIL